MVFFMEISNFWRKSEYLCFADFFPEIFKAGMDFPMDFWVNVIHQWFV
jgi:hypothetical protein